MPPKKIFESAFSTFRFRKINFDMQAKEQKWRKTDSGANREGGECKQKHRGKSSLVEVRELGRQVQTDRQTEGNFFCSIDRLHNASRLRQVVDICRQADLQAVRQAES
jgi:hypothetical protein